VAWQEIWLQAFSL